MSDEQKGTPLFKFFFKSQLLTLSFFIVIPAYAILGAAVLHNYVLYTLGTLLLAYGILYVGVYIVYIIDSIVRWLRSGFRNSGETRDEEDYMPSLLPRVCLLLLIANVLMFLLRFIFPADSPIHEFSYFPLRVLVLQAVATGIVYKYEQSMDNLF